MDKDFEGGWQEMRHDAERLSKEIKKRFWGLESNAMYGIHYDDYADILFDLHRNYGRIMKRRAVGQWMPKTLLIPLAMNLWQRLK